MFVVTEEDDVAIRAVYEQRGEFAAAIELRQRFPASPTTRRHGNAPAPSPAGSRCRCGRGSGRLNRRGYVGWSDASLGSGGRVWAPRGNGCGRGGAARAVAQCLALVAVAASFSVWVCA